MENVAPLAAHRHFCRHLYHAESSAAAYVPGRSSVVVLFAYGGAQDGEVAGCVLRSGMKGQRFNDVQVFVESFGCV